MDVQAPPDPQMQEKVFESFGQNARMLVKKKHLFGLFCLQVFIIRHPSGVHRAGCECPSGAWEFPSTKAVLPLFVTPQRPSGSLARDPDLTLSSVYHSCVPTLQRNHTSNLLRGRKISDLVMCVHLQVCIKYERVYACVSREEISNKA